MQKERQILSFSLGFDVLFYFKLFYFWLFYFRLCAIEVPYKTADGRVLASTQVTDCQHGRNNRADRPCCIIPACRQPHGKSVLRDTDRRSAADRQTRAIKY